MPTEAAKLEDGRQPLMWHEVVVALLEGDRVFVAHEMDEEPFECTNIAVLQNYALDQCLLVTAPADDPGRAQRIEQAAADMQAHARRVLRSVGPDADHDRVLAAAFARGWEAVTEDMDSVELGHGWVCCVVRQEDGRAEMGVLDPRGVDFGPNLTLSSEATAKAAAPHFVAILCDERGLRPGQPFELAGDAAQDSVPAEQAVLRERQH